MARVYKEVNVNGKDTGKVYKPITRYLKVKSAECTKRSRYADYCYFEDCEDKASYLFFMWDGRKIALGEVECLTCPIFIRDADGYDIPITGYYVMSNCLSVLIEIDCNGECVRLWREGE